MTAVKLCGMTCKRDIMAANALLPEYIGFVFVKGRKRYIPPHCARQLGMILDRRIKAVGVFIDAPVGEVAALLREGIIDLAQLHGQEDDGYIGELKRLCDRPVIKAFRVGEPGALERAGASTADTVLLDSGAGSGKPFDWSLLRGFKRPYFLAGGLEPGNVVEAVTACDPYGVDVSSGIETDGRKDPVKMRKFMDAIHGRNQE